MSEVLDSDIDPVPASKETVVRDSEIGIGSSHAYRPKEWAEQPNLLRLVNALIMFFHMYRMIILLAAIEGRSSSLAKDRNIQSTAIWQVILAVLPVPGVVVGAWLRNIVDRRYTVIIGFAGYVALGCSIGGTHSRLSNHIAAFVVLYGLLQAFGHTEPGATIGLTSSEAFPTAMRGTGYSVSDAFGRTGAAIGTECFRPLEKAAGKGSTFYLAGSVGVLGMIVYWFLPESGDVNLEEEDVNLAKYMAEHGFSMNPEF